MSDTPWNPLRNIDNHCFGCGPENHHGLKMQFLSNGEQVRGNVTVPPHLRGWRNLVHGGILATIIDETMSWSAIHLLRRFILTKEMTVSYKKPVPVGTSLIATGYLRKRKDERNATMEATITDTHGDICCKGKGEFVLFTHEQFSEMKLLPEELLREMAEIFASSSAETGRMI